jgi:hypothetical protein
MDIPRLLFGQRGEVRKRVAAVIRAIAGGETLSAERFGPLMSTDDEPDALVLFNPGRGNSGYDAFHCYALLYGLMQAIQKRRVPAHLFDDAFAWSLEAVWSFAGTLGEAGSIFFLQMPREAFTREPPPEILRGKPEWYAPFLKAALLHWQVLEGVGERFASGAGGEARAFSRVCFTLYQVLAKCGVALQSSDVDTPTKARAAVQVGLARLEN